MKAFTLEEYLKDPERKVVTRDGRNVRILCTDRRNSRRPIVALIEDENNADDVYTFKKDGSWDISGEENINDLFFAPEKKEGWINILKGTYDARYIEHTRIFKSKEDAEKALECYSDYITTLKIEWEE